MSHLNLFELELSKRHLANEQKIKDNLEKLNPMNKLKDELKDINIKFEKHLNIISDDDIFRLASIVSVIEYLIVKTYATPNLDTYTKMLHYFDKLDKYLEKYDNM